MSDIFDLKKKIPDVEKKIEVLERRLDQIEESHRDELGRHVDLIGEHEEQIEELQEKVDFMESEFKCKSKSFSIRVKKRKKNKKQLNELKEHWSRQQDEIDYLLKWKDQIWGQVANLQGFAYNQSDDKWEPISIIEEVLRELGNIVIRFIHNVKNYDNDDVFAEWDEICDNFKTEIGYLLAKLSARSAGQTEKKEHTSGKIKDGYYLNIFGEITPIPKIEDSGGEKTGVDRNHGKSALSLTHSDSTDSKLPELKCPICNSKIELATELDCPTCESELFLKDILNKLPELKDLGMVTAKNGNLIEYTPSQFVKDYAKTHNLFSLYGIMFPEDENPPESPKTKEGSG